MKNVSKSLLTVALMAVARVAFAHTQGGALGKTTTSTAASDVYLVSCYDDGQGAGTPTKLYLHVKGSGIATLPKINIQATRLGAVVTSTVAANNNVYSAAVTLVKGEGDYGLYINKPASTVKGVVNYTAEFHCQSASGGHAGTDWYMTQNQ